MRVLLALFTLISSIETINHTPSYNEESLRIYQIFYKTWLDGYVGERYKIIKTWYKTA